MEEKNQDALYETITEQEAIDFMFGCPAAKGKRDMEYITLRDQFKAAFGWTPPRLMMTADSDEIKAAMEKSLEIGNPDPVKKLISDVPPGALI